MVWEDGGYGLIEWKQSNEFGRHTNLAFGNPDWLQLASAFGWNGHVCRRAATCRGALEAAFDEDGTESRRDSDRLQRKPAADEETRRTHVQELSADGQTLGIDAREQSRRPPERSLWSRRTTARRSQRSTRAGPKHAEDALAAAYALYRNRAGWLRLHQRVADSRAARSVDERTPGRARAGSGARRRQAAGRLARRDHARHRRRASLHRTHSRPCRRRDSDGNHRGGRRPRCVHAEGTDRRRRGGERVQPSPQPDRSSGACGSRGGLPGDRQTGEHHAAVVFAPRRVAARSRLAGRLVSGCRERSCGGRATRHRSSRGVLQLHRQRRSGLVAAFEARARHPLRARTRRRCAGDHRAERRCGVVDQRRSEGRLLSRGAGVRVGAARVCAARAGARLGAGVGGSREAIEDRRSHRCCHRGRSADSAQRNEAHSRMGDGRGGGGRGTVVRRRSH